MARQCGGSAALLAASIEATALGESEAAIQLLSKEMSSKYALAA